MIFSRETKLESVVSSLLCARIHNAEQYKEGRSDGEWAQMFAEFYQVAITLSIRQGGEFVKCLTAGILCVFPTPKQAVQAAIDLQEFLLEKRCYPVTALSCGIGIASGQVNELLLDGKQVDLLGRLSDVALQLSEQARGHAILLHYADPIVGTEFPIHSLAGEVAERAPVDYFQELPAFFLQGHMVPFKRYAIHWQGNPGEYLTSSPLELDKATLQEESFQGRSYFGKVSAFKKERGFGFIQYYADNREYQEIYFHMTYITQQVSVFENDHVQFVIKPGKEGRPQACSILVMGSRLQGRVESCASDGSGFITIRDQESKLIRFFVVPQEVQYESMSVDDLVEFTAGSGSEAEGLIALQITRQGEAIALLSSEISGENLVIGAIEQAVVTVYFPEKGYGFAKCKRNSVYIHVSELTDPEHVPGTGDVILFEVYPGRNETYRANNVRLVKKRGLDL